MSRLPPLPSLREILSLFNITAKKRLSQNFLMNMKVCEEIVRVGFGLSSYHFVAANNPWTNEEFQLPRNFSKDDLHSLRHTTMKDEDMKYYNKIVIEIGPGPGAITRPLLDAGCKQLIAVELDERFFPGLGMIGQICDRFQLVHGDILTVNERELLETLCKPEDYTPESWEKESPVAFVGNLPFGISTPLLFKWMRQVSTRTGSFGIAGRSEMILMFQDEVAERIIAKPNTKEYGRLSVVAQNQCHCEYLFKVRSGSFTPPPKVDGAMVKLTPRVTPLVDISSIFLEEMCNIVFKSRRKNLLNNFRLVGVSDEVTRQLFQITKDVPDNAYTARGESLTVKQIASLAKVFFMNPQFTEASKHLREKAEKRSIEPILKPNLSELDEMERLASKAISKRKKSDHL